MAILLGLAAVLAGLSRSNRWSPGNASVLLASEERLMLFGADLGCGACCLCPGRITLHVACKKVGVVYLNLAVIFATPTLA